VTAFVTRYALAYPSIAFHLSMEGKVEFHTSGSGNRREVLSDIYGVEFARQLLEVDFEEGTHLYAATSVQSACHGQTGVRSPFLSTVAGSRILR